MSACLGFRCLVSVFLLTVSRLLYALFSGKRVVAVDAARLPFAEQLGQGMCAFTVVVDTGNTGNVVVI